MRRLDRVFVGEFLGPFFAALVLFTTVVVFSGIAPSLRYLHDPSIGDVVTWVGWQFPAYVVQAMPVAVAFAALVSMGGLVRRRELLAMRAGGVNPRRPIVVLFVVGIVLALLGLVDAQWGLPTAAAKVTETWWPMTSGRSGLFRLAGRTLFMGTGDLYFERAEGGRMVDVRFTRRRHDVVDAYFADDATFDGRVLVLSNVRHVVLDLNSLGALGTAASSRLPKLVPVDTRASRVRIRTSADERTWLVRYSGATYEGGHSLTALWSSAHNASRTPIARFQDRVTFFRKIIEPLANVAILIVAVPLAVRFASSTVLSFGLTLAVAVAWYLSLAGSELAARAGLLSPSGQAWSVLAPFIVVGLLLTRLAARR